jgi:hypothetical protein
MAAHCLQRLNCALCFGHVGTQSPSCSWAQALHFKLTSYASTVYGAAHHPQPHEQQQPQTLAPAHVPPLFRPRRSEDTLRNARLQV